MPSLQVRDMPAALYKKLAEKAKKEHRSLAQQAMVELASSLKIELNNRERRLSVLEDLSSLNAGFDALSLPDPVELVRKDRER